MAGRAHRDEYYRAAMAFFRARREDAGLTQAAVAEALGISEEHYSRWETGAKPVTDRGVRQLLRLTRAAPAELEDFVRARTTAPGKTGAVPNVAPAGEPEIGRRRHLRRRLLVMGAAASALAGAWVVAAVRSGPHAAGPVAPGQARASAVTRSIRPATPAHLRRATPAELKTVGAAVEASQKFEDLTLYADPASFGPQTLGRYWVAGGPAAREVADSVRRLRTRGWRYGPDSRNTLFQVRGVHVSVSGDYAEAETLEGWYLPVYDAGGARVPDRNPFYPATVTRYALRKCGGRWLVLSTSTPYNG